MNDSLLAGDTVPSDLRQMIVYRTSDQYPQALGQVVTYFALHGLSFVLNGALLITFFSHPRRLHRDALIKNLLIVFVLCNVTTCLLLLSGHLWRGSSPNYTLCLVNGAFINGGSNAMGAAALALVFRVFSLILSSKGILMKFTASRLVTVCLVLLPYAIWTAFFVASLVDIHDKKSVHKASFYCVIENDSLTSIGTYTVAATEALTVIFQVAIGIILFLQARKLRTLHRGQDSMQGAMGEKKSPFAMRGLSPALILRVALFGACVLVALIVSVIVSDDFTSIVGDFFITAIAPTAAFIFASQRDVLEVWRILPARPNSSSSHHSSSDRARAAGFQNADVEDGYALPTISKTSQTQPDFEQTSPPKSPSKQYDRDDLDATESIAGDSTSHLNPSATHEGKGGHWWRARERERTRSSISSGSYADVRILEGGEPYAKGGILVTIEREEIRDEVEDVEQEKKQDSLR